MSKTLPRSTQIIYKDILKQFSDPIRMMIFIKILRKPDITSNKLKKDLHISGTKIYYYLNQLSQASPPLIYESETEKVTDHLIRRKFRITEEIKNILYTYFDPRSNSKEFRLYKLYISNAVIQQQIRETKAGNHSDLEKMSQPMLMFVDDEIAMELREGINSVFTKCYNKYKNVDRIESIQVCKYSAIAGIYMMN